LYENGITAYGIDITDTVHFGLEENVLAVKVDNRTDYKERATGTPFEWNANDFNPDHGGINRHVWLHVTGEIHQTLPLYYGLETSGVYVHAASFDIAKKTADITVDSEVRNDSGERATVSLSVVIVDHRGQTRVEFESDPVDIAKDEKRFLTASARSEVRASGAPRILTFTTYTPSSKLAEKLSTSRRPSRDSVKSSSKAAQERAVSISMRSLFT